MATATPPRREAIDAASCDQQVVMHGITWEGYRRLLRLRGDDRSVPRLIYLDGSVTFVSPAYTHEWLKKRLGRFVDAVTEVLGIRCKGAGSTTFRRRSKRGGVEGDETYYIANEPRVRGRKVDPKADPPPDLAIEVVHTHDATDAVEVYRRLGVPEVWVCGEAGLMILLLEHGEYAESPTSRAFPFLAAAEIFTWVGRPEADDLGEMEWGPELRRWVEQTLIPRVGRGPADPNT